MVNGSFIIVLCLEFMVCAIFLYCGAKVLQIFGKYKYLSIFFAKKNETAFWTVSFRLESTSRTSATSRSSKGINLRPFELLRTL